MRTTYFVQGVCCWEEGSGTDWRQQYRQQRLWKCYIIMAYVEVSTQHLYFINCSMLIHSERYCTPFEYLNDPFIHNPHNSWNQLLSCANFAFESWNSILSYKSFRSSTAGGAAAAAAAAAAATKSAAGVQCSGRKTTAGEKAIHCLFYGDEKWKTDANKCATLLKSIGRLETWFE